MKTYSEFAYVQEHNPMTVKSMIKKINPRDKLQDRIKKKGLAGTAKDSLKDKIDKLNPFSDMNKAKTMAKKKDLKGLKNTRTGLKQKLGVLNVKINDLEDKIRR